MRNVIFAINISIDGYCGHESMSPDDDTMAFFTRMLQDTGVEVMGRNTYDLMYPYWHEVAASQSGSPAENEFALAFDALQKVVFSKTMKSAEWANTTLLHSGLREEIEKLKQQPGKDIFIGGLDTGSQVAAWGLIDEYYFVVHPVIVGEGPRLFAQGGRHALELIDQQTFASGVVVLHYRRSRKADL